MAWVAEKAVLLGDTLPVMRDGVRVQFPEGTSLSVGGAFYQGNRSFLIEALEEVRGELIIAVAREVRDGKSTKGRSTPKPSRKRVQNKAESGLDSEDRKQPKSVDSQSDAASSGSGDDDV